MRERNLWACALLPLLLAGCRNGAPTASSGRCGGFRIGDYEVTFDCGLPTWLPSPSRALNRRALRLQGGPVPNVVDHREDGTEGPIRQQGLVGDCTANALATLIDHALARGGSPRPAPVSAMHLWSRYAEALAGRAVDANLHRGVTTEQRWPYDQRTACSWLACGASDRCSSSLGVRCGQHPDPARSALAEQNPSAQLLEVTEVEPDPDTLREVLARGQDVWLNFHVDDHVSRFERRPFGMVIQHYDARAGQSGHSTVLAGYRREADGTYYLVHNSWGSRWGQGGYAWMAERTLLANTELLFVIDAAPAQPGTDLTRPPADNTPPRPPAAPQPAHRVQPFHRGTTACAQPGQAPDALDHRCAPVCPDGSPRVGGACPGATACPQGMVEASGSCVHAAPRGTGQDPATGVRWSCAPGGCTYTIPQGRLGCARSECTRSCPAPRFVLAAGVHGASCTE